MNDDYTPPKTPPQNVSSDDSEQYVGSERVFDISEDNISPITDESSAFIQKNAEPTNKPFQPSERPQQPQQPQQKQQSDTDLLDKKIGTFDTTPFAPVKNIQVGTPVATPITTPAPIPTRAPIQNQTPFAPIQKQQPVTPLQPRSVTPPANLPTGQPVPNQPSPQQLVTLVPKKPSPIPLQDISFPLNKIKGRNIQDEITNVLPANLRQQKSQPPISKPQIPTLRPQQSPTFQPIQVKSATPISPTQPVVQEEKSQTEIAKPIRTYEGDVAEAMSHKRTSSASIAIAESQRQEGEEKLVNEEPSHAGRKIAMVLISIILLSGGAIGAYYLYSISPLAPVTQVTPQQKAAPSLVPSDTQVVMTIDNQNPIITQSRMQNELFKAQAPNTIKEIIPAIKDASGALQRITAPEMIRAMDINAPDILTRSLGSNWMLGIYADNENNKSVFVVVTSTFFQNTFAGMLQWESVMADDLKQYLYPVEPAGISNTSAQKDAGAFSYRNPLDNLDSILPATASSSTASSTQKQATSTKLGSTTAEITKPLQPYFTLRGKFEDRIVKNKDVREFRTDAGITLFLYSFIDNSHLVITSSEATLAEILTRLEKQSFIR